MSTSSNESIEHGHNGQVAPSTTTDDDSSKVSSNDKNGEGGIVESEAEAKTVPDKNADHDEDAGGSSTAPVTSTTLGTDSSDSERDMSVSPSPAPTTAPAPASAAATDPAPTTSTDTATAPDTIDESRSITLRRRNAEVESDPEPRSSVRYSTRLSRPAVDRPTPSPVKSANVARRGRLSFCRERKRPKPTSDDGGAPSTRVTGPRARKSAKKNSTPENAEQNNMDLSEDDAEQEV